MKNKGKLYSIHLFSVVFVFVFLISVSSTTLAVSTEGVESKLTITETQITTNKSFQDSPAIHGNRIVWSDNRNGDWDIYMYDLSASKETQITNNKSNQYCPAIYGNRIVWLDTRNRDYDIYMYDLSTFTETYISSASWCPPAIYGDRIVWQRQNDSLFEPGICMYNISTSKIIQITNSTQASSPYIYDDRIVWIDMRTGDYNVYMKNISTSKEVQITASRTDKRESAIYGDRIAWKEYRNGNWNIYTYNLSTSTETQVTTNRSLKYDSIIFDEDFAIYDDKIVWKDDRDGDEKYDIYMYNLSTSKEVQITSNKSNQIKPDIFGDTIVWADNRNDNYDQGTINYDIYMATISSIPFASFSAIPTSGIAPLEVSFTDDSTGLFTSWKWDFGDGISSAEENPAHIYNEAGKYVVNLTVSNGKYTSSRTLEIYVQDAVAPPEVYFKTNVTSGYVPFSVMFTDLSQNATSRIWDFNNDSAVDSTEKKPVYVYMSPGTYTVNLTVSNVKGVTSKQTNVTASPAERVDGQLILTESRITTNESMQTNPDIYGDKIVWMDWHNGVVYMYNLSTSKETQVKSYLDSSKGDPHIYRDKVVYIDTSERDIYMYDLSTSKETRITTNNSDSYSPDIHGDRIVWKDYRNGGSDIYMYNLSSSVETQITNNKSSQEPAIYGDRIVWQDNRNGESWDEHGNLISYGNIYMYNLSTYTETQITTSESAQYPDIYGDRIVWMDKRNGNWDIYMYDLSTSKETQITNNELVQRYPAIFGNRIVWESYREDDEAEVLDPDNYNIYMFDISTSKETKITTIESYKATPAIYDDKIVWTDYRNENPDIYMCTISERELESKLPAANLTVNQTDGCCPLTVLFTDISEDSTSRSWDVNSDGIEDSNKSSFVYVYDSAGTYTAKLTAINANGTNIKTAQIIVDRKSSSGTGSGGVGSMSPEPAKNIEVKELCQAFITNCKAVQFDLVKSETCVVYVCFDSKKTVGKTTATVEQLKTKSTLVSNLSEGEVYKYFNVWVGNSGFASSENIENPVVCFKVEKSWIQDKKIDKDSIALNRYTNKTWECMPVSLSGEDSEYLYFTANVPGYTFFAITGKSDLFHEGTATKIQPNDSDNTEDIKNSGSEINKEPKEEGKTGTPGFDIVYGIAGLLSVFLYRKR